MVVTCLIFLVTISATSLTISSAQQCTLNGYPIIEEGLTEQDMAIILGVHNELRKAITSGRLAGQPKGVNVPELEWDEELARKAQLATNTCDFEHLDVEDDRWYVGQNLFLQKSTEIKPGADWKRAFQSWLEEAKKYKYGPFIRANLETGHFTQMIWAETEKMGCGYTYYETQDKMRYQKIYVCNYGPGGNILKQYPYEKI